MKILYFALLRERVGIAEETLTLPAAVRTVGDLVTWLKDRSAGHAAALADPALVRVAVNQDYAQPDHAVQDSDEIAFFPPVTGG